MTRRPFSKIVSTSGWIRARLTPRATILKTAQCDFRIRLTLAMQAGGLGNRIDALHAWLEQRLGRDGYAITAAANASRGDAISIHFDDPALSAELMRWLTDPSVRAG
jgi:hypothetical protein